MPEPTTAPRCRPPDEFREHRWHWLVNWQEQRMMCAEFRRGTGTTRQMVWRVGYHWISQTRAAEIGWEYVEPAQAPERVMHYEPTAEPA